MKIEDLWVNKYSLRLDGTETEVHTISEMNSNTHTDRGTVAVSIGN